MAQDSLVWLDITPSSIVIVCNECPHWRGLALNRDDAWERAANHERDCHPESDQGRAATRKRTQRKRHAVAVI